MSTFSVPQDPKEDLIAEAMHLIQTLDEESFWIVIGELAALSAALGRIDDDERCFIAGLIRAGGGIVPDDLIPEHDVYPFTLTVYLGAPGHPVVMKMARHMASMDGAAPAARKAYWRRAQQFVKELHGEYVPGHIFGFEDLDGGHQRATSWADLIAMLKL